MAVVVVVGWVVVAVVAAVGAVGEVIAVAVVLDHGAVVALECTKLRSRETFTKLYIIYILAH